MVTRTELAPMDEFGSFSTTFGTRPSKVGSAQFDFQQGVNANLAQWLWGIILLNMHGNAPIEVMLHIYFSFEYVKFIHYQINRSHDGAFIFNAL
jgi:hypothetical protein